MHVWAGRLAATVLLILCAVPSGGCGDSTISAQWAGDTVEVDGWSSDWDNLRTTYFEEEKIVLGLANDSTNFYILFRFQDPQWARSIRMSGLTFWLDPEGGKDRNIVLTYNGGPSMEQLRDAPGGEADDNHRQLPPEMQQRRDQMMKNREPQLQIEIKDRIAQMPIATDGSVGPKVAFAMDHGMYCYEFSIPLHEIGVRSYGLGVAPGAKIGLGAKWGGMPSDRSQRGMGGGGMMGGGPPGGGTFGGGPPGGGGGPGGMGGPPGGERMQTPREQDVALKVLLAPGSNASAENEVGNE
ncbi:hypothetical protein KQH82_08565 [bacterium]|nr:hypothetical protein [bacterium]